MIGQLNSWAYKLEKVAKYTRQIKSMQIDSKPSPHLLGHSFLDADPFVTTGCPSVPRGNCGTDFNPSPHFRGHRRGCSHIRRGCSHIRRPCSHIRRACSPILPSVPAVDSHRTASRGTRPFSSDNTGTVSSNSDLSVIDTLPKNDMGLHFSQHRFSHFGLFVPPSSQQTEQESKQNTSGPV